MPKVCSHANCTNNVFSKGLCLNHWRPMYQKPIKKTVASTPAKPRKAIAKVSKNRQQALATYRRRRDKYFEDHPTCEYPGCTSTKITLHHMKGRIGSFLTDKRYFKSLCQKHHRFVEENPEEAKKLNLSKSRLDKFA